jgi:hypothetical protein
MPTTAAVDDTPVSVFALTAARCCLIFSALQGERRPGFVGLPLPGVEVKVVVQQSSSSSNGSNSSSNGSSNGNGDPSSEASASSEGSSSEGGWC